jgi:hypothetical protein
MMGRQQGDQGRLFYEFRLEDRIPRESSAARKQNRRRRPRAGGIHRFNEGGRLAHDQRICRARGLEDGCVHKMVIVGEIIPPVMSPDLPMRPHHGAPSPFEAGISLARRYGDPGHQDPRQRALADYSQANSEDGYAWTHIALPDFVCRDYVTLSPEAPSEAQGVAPPLRCTSCSTLAFARYGHYNFFRYGAGSRKP